jgi:hypothetical protein
VAAIFSTSLAAAEVSSNSAEWPTGSGWIIQVGPQGASHTAPDWEVPASPVLPDSVLPNATSIAPSELEFDITRAIRRGHSPRGNRSVRIRRPAEIASHGACSRHKSQFTHCRGWMGHPRGRR